MVTCLPNTPLGFLGNLGPWEIGLIVVLALLLFGGKKLPELARGAGKAIKEFRGATHEAEKTFKDAMNEAEVAQKKDTDETSKPPAGNTKAVS